MIYAIGDLHLSDGEKPMDVFGTHWENHFERIQQDWTARVQPADTVLVPGDISWAMQLGDAARHLERIAVLPGQKILLKGNHDYWWSSIGRVRASLPENMLVLQNDCVPLEQCVICGTRGWLFPQDEGLSANEERIYQRELIRLRMSLSAAQAVRGERPLLAMMHFPPLSDAVRDTGFTALLEEYGVERVIYGHLHGYSIKSAFRGLHHGIQYDLVSCDSLGFTLMALE